MNDLKSYRFLAVLETTEGLVQQNLFATFASIPEM